MLIMFQHNNLIIVHLSKTFLKSSQKSFRLDDEVVRVAVGMRLGLALCAPHSCPCGGQMDAQGKAFKPWCAKERQVELPDVKY